MISRWWTQILYYLQLLALVPVFPFLFWQAKRLKARMPQLPEAAKNKTGQISGKQPAINILALGESSIAGVGVVDQRMGIAGQLAKSLQEKTGRLTRWTVVARKGFNAKMVLDHLVAKIPTAPLDLVVIGLGGNDTFEFTPPLRWRRHMEQLVQKIRQRFPDCPIVLCNMIPVKEFPLFPPLLRWFMGRQIGLLGNMLADFPRQFHKVYFEGVPIHSDNWLKGKKIDTYTLFSDGVHPSAITYTLWAQDIARFIEREKIL